MVWGGRHVPAIRSHEVDRNPPRLFNFTEKNVDDAERAALRFCCDQVFRNGERRDSTLVFAEIGERKRELPLPVQADR
jgi:hypothetical protein